MKTEVKPNTCEQTPGRIELDARYKSIGISAVAAAIRYNGNAAQPDRDDDDRTRSAA